MRFNRSSAVMGIAMALLVPCLTGCANKAHNDGRQDAVAKAPVERFVITLNDPPVEKVVGWWYAAFTPDARRFVADGGIYDAQTGQRLGRISQKGRGHMRVRKFAMSPDGATIAFADDGFRGPGNTEHWYGVSFASLDTGKTERTIEIPDIAIGRVYFPTRSRAVAVSSDKMYLLDVDRGEVVRSRGNVNYRTTAVSPDGKQYAQIHVVFPKEDWGGGRPDPASLKYVVSLHDLESGEETARLPETPGMADSLGWTADGKYIVVSAKPRMAVIDVSAKSLATPELNGWQPVIPPRMVSNRFLLLTDEKYASNAFLDLTTCSLVPIAAPTGKHIIAIAPDDKIVVVRGIAAYLGSIDTGQGSDAIGAKGVRKALRMGETPMSQPRPP